MSDKTDGLLAQHHLLLSIIHTEWATRLDHKVAAVIIERYFSKFGNARASLRYLADRTGATRPNVIASVRRLTDNGAFTVLREGAGTRPTEFGLNFHFSASGIAHDTSASGIADNTSCGIADDTSTASSGIAHDTKTSLTVTGLQAGLRDSENFEAAPVAPPGSGLEGRPGAVPASGAEGDFLSFWNAWPRKHGKKKAEAEWRRIDGNLHDKVIATAAIWAEHYIVHGVDKKWIPEPANWLKGARWDEDLPIIHIDAKGAAIAKAKANARPAPEPSNDNQPDDDDDWSGPMICDVGPFAPFGTFHATITGSTVEHVDEETEKVVIDLSWGNPAYGPDAQHTFYYKHPDQKVQMRGRIFLSRLAKILGNEVTDTEQLHGLHVKCKINERLAISYSEAA